jgi:hypothetical protein
MEFHEYLTTQREAGENKIPHREFALRAAELLSYVNKDSSKLYGIRMHMECLWMEARAPYYNVYPVVIEAMKNTTLDIPVGAFRLPLASPILLRFAKGHEPTAWGKVRSILACEHSSGDGYRGVALCVYHGDSRCDHTLIRVPLYPDTYKLEAILSNCDATGPVENAQEGCKACIKTLLSICLMADDPELVTPEVLSKDLPRFLQTGEQSLIDRAVRRGKYGFSVGARLTVDPHFRRPHFAIRWCESGRRVPKIRPIKGCIVHRQQAIKVPTGHGVSP